MTTALSLLSVVYALMLWALLFGMDTLGERHWFLSMCLYVPPCAWLAPLVVLSPLCIPAIPSLILLHMFCVLMVAGVYMAPSRPSPSPPATGGGFTILSNNLGEHKETGVHAFISQTEPDFIVLQDAIHFGRVYGRELPQYPYYKAYHEFAAFSKFPITDSGVISVPVDNWGLPIAMWYNVAVRGRTIRVYNVRLLSPRGAMQLANRLGKVTPANPGDRGGFRDWLAMYRNSLALRIRVSDTLFDVISKSPTPVIAAGDFNFPDHGYLYHAYARILNDTFRHAGSGYGMTYPGYTNRKRAVFGRILRLDYIFSSPELRIQRFYLEGNRDTQHRGIATVFVYPDERDER